MTACSESLSRLIKQLNGIIAIGKAFGAFGRLFCVEAEKNEIDRQKKSMLQSVHAGKVISSETNNNRPKRRIA